MSLPKSQNMSSELRHMAEARFPNTFTVPKKWLDYNGHMNMGYYMVAFDHYATDHLFECLGIGLSYVKEARKSLFTLGANIDYRAEGFENMRLQTTTHLLDWDAKRLHYFHSLTRDDNQIVATNECLSIHVNMESRRSENFPDTLLATIEEVGRIHAQLPSPEHAGRILGIRR